MAIKQLTQTNKRTCGQACVAMAAGVSIQKVIEALGNHKGFTSTADIAQLLRHFKLKPRIRKRVCLEDLPKRALISYKRRTKRGWLKHGHWVLLWDGKEYDPSPKAVRTVIDLTGR